MTPITFTVSEEVTQAMLGELQPDREIIKPKLTMPVTQKHFESDDTYPPLPIGVI